MCTFRNHLAASALACLAAVAGQARAGADELARHHPAPPTPSAPVLVHDGKSFSLAPDPNIAFEFSIPANVVLTDVVLSLTAPAQAVTVFVGRGDGNQTLIFQSVGGASSTFAASHAGMADIHLQSGLQDPMGLRVGLYCNNVGGNVCQGALMWSGYQR